jgi:hypothetical protein
MKCGVEVSGGDTLVASSELSNVVAEWSTTASYFIAPVFGFFDFLV